MPLSNRESFFKTVLENLQGDIAIIDSGFRYVYVNPYAINDPVIREWIIGKTDLDYCLFRGVDPEVAHQRRDKFSMAIETRKLVEWEEKFTDKDGVQRVFLRRIYPVMNDEKNEVSFMIGHGLDITERRKIRSELEANKRFTDTVLNSSPNLIFVKDVEGRFLLANKAVADIFNKTVDAILKKSNEDLHENSEEVKSYSDVDRQVIESGKTIRVEETFTKANGDVLWYETVKVPLVESDGTINVLGISTDITERKLKEQELRFREQQLAEAQKLTKSGNWIRYLEDNRLEWSEGLFTIWEFPMENGVPQLADIMATVHKDDHNILQESLNEIIESGVEREIQYRINVASGEKIVRTLARPILDEDKNVTAIFGSVMDVTRQVVSEKNLLLNEQRLNEAQQLAKMGSYELEYPGFEIRYSPGCYDIYEWDPSQPAPTALEFENFLHPDDKPYLTELWKQLPERNETFETYFRIFTKSGQLKHIRVINRPERDENGQLLRVIGTISDVTEQKNNEERLRQNEERLNEAQEMAKVGSYVFNSKTNKIKWSKGMYAIWELDEATDLDLDVFYKYLHPDDDAYVRSMMEMLSNRGESWKLTYRILTAKGNVKWVEVYSKFVTSGDGISKLVVGSCQDITESKLFEERSRLNEQRLFEAQELARSGSWEIDVLPQIKTAWTPGMFKVWDKPLDSEPPTAEEFYEHIVEEDREKVHAALRKLIDKGEPAEVQFRVITWGGKKKVFFSRGKAIFNNAGQVVKIVGSNTDVTERQETEERLRSSEQGLLFAQTIAKLGSWTLDLKTKEAEWLTGMYIIWERDTSLPPPSFEESRNMFHPDDREKVDESILLSINTGQEQAAELRIVLPNGKLKYLDVRSRLIKDDQADTLKLFGTVMDITERKIVEEELIRARTEAEDSAKAKENFLANISHELRTPLNGILGMARMLQKTNLNTTQREYTDVLNQTTGNLLVIINDILDFAKIESGSLSLEEMTFDPARVADTAIQLQMFKAEEKDLMLRHLHEGAVPLPVVSGDPYRLNQILLNLLNNAIKYTNHGEVILTHKVVEESPEYVKIQFTVKDTGIGIPKNMHQKIFESFTQVHPTEKQKGGVGLGLAITKSLVERQGGNIWLESTPDIGSTFNFFITYRKANGNGEQGAAGQFESMNLGSLKILLAEDNKVNLFITEAMLIDWGFKVDVAMNGQEAVNLARENNYDLILMDIQMPVMDGLEATKQIRKLKSKKKAAIPIIALTANTGRQAHKQFMAEGMNDWLVKPFKEESLYKKIAMHIKEKDWLSDSMRKRKFPVRKKPIVSSDVLLYDLSGLTKDAPGNISFLKRMLTIFIETIPSIVEKMFLHFNAGELEDLSALAHKIKPTLDGAGIHSLKETIRNIEGVADKRRTKEMIEADLLFLKRVIDQVTVKFKEEIEQLN